MEPITLIVVSMLVIIALATIALPLWKQTRPEALFRVSSDDHTIEEYEARYQAVLAAIKDLMFDHEMGKVDDQDYELLLNKAKVEAATIRQTIDRLSIASDTLSNELDEQIEMLIDQARQKPTAASSALTDRIEAEIALLKEVHLDKSGTDSDHTCTDCGTPIQPDDLFCAVCGKSVQSTSSSAANYCPNCGRMVQQSDTFCTKCGTELYPAPVETEP
jgi:predicted RNA-binding Zn-ribbon protein involved in translation (DUF1610 family)